MPTSTPTSVTFLGAAGTVTGSKFLIEHGGHRLLVDCGLYQGEREWRRLNWKPLPVVPSSINDVVLTHSHLDHCGYLPALVRQGFGGPTWATEATAELAAIVLRDSAHLQEEDAEYARRGGYSRHDPPLPLYTEADAELSIKTVPRRARSTRPATSAATCASPSSGPGTSSAPRPCWSRRASRACCCRGDLGRPDHPCPAGAGGPAGGPHRRPRVDLRRPRPPRAAGRGARRASPTPSGAPSRRGGSVVIPAFAVDRTELVLATLADMLERGVIPSAPIYVDSPMALAALHVYRSARYRGEIKPGAICELDRWPGLHTAHTADESRALNRPRKPSIIISASGMASGGRVVHHLKSLLPDQRNTVVLTGYQAAGTRGRALLDGAHEVKIMGRYVPVRAEIVSDEEFSVHADSSELMDWLLQIPEPPETVYLVHGELTAAQALADRIRHETGWTVAVPRLGERVLAD